VNCVAVPGRFGLPRPNRMAAREGRQTNTYMNGVADRICLKGIWNLRLSDIDAVGWPIEASGEISRWSWNVSKTCDRFPWLASRIVEKGS
jgi:hypothetical protein